MPDPTLKELKKQRKQVRKTARTNKKIARATSHLTLATHTGNKVKAHKAKIKIAKLKKGKIAKPVKVKVDKPKRKDTPLAATVVDKKAL